MSGKHTPGPWQSHYAFDVTGYPCFFIHGISGEQKHNAVVLEANTKLIAAAPDLLAACKAAALKMRNPMGSADESLTNVDTWNRVLGICETAIRQAED
jgi:hypothetical protein